VIVAELLPGPVPTKFAVHVVDNDGYDECIATPVEVVSDAPPPRSRPLVQVAVAFGDTTP
jgi:hypothetical protein